MVGGGAAAAGGSPFCQSRTQRWHSTNAASRSRSRRLQHSGYKHRPFTRTHPDTLLLWADVLVYPVILHGWLSEEEGLMSAG